MKTERPRKRRSWIKTMFYLILLAAIAVAVAWLFGPREPVDLEVRFDPSTLGDDIEAYLERTEAGVADLRNNAAKEIVWAYPASRSKTPVGLIYLHGFSAAKGEIRPVPETAAKELGANLFYTRLTGHGRDGRAMASASVSDWVQDTAEALAVGGVIGEKVVIVSTSSGGTLAALAATLPELKDRIAGIVFVSPNFAMQASAASMLTVPFAETVVPLLAGAERSFEPASDEHASNWTTRYPTVSLIPMAALVKHVRTLPYELIGVPALFIYHEGDQVVDHAMTAEIASRWGGPVTTLAVDSADDPSNHVIAGDIMSPSNNGRTAQAIVDFAKSL